jgi:uncharacterized surface protein with fasciclin (FAS1) repeats
MRIRNIFRIAALSCMLIVLFQSCDKKDTPPPTDTLTSVIASNPELSLFSAAITRAKLTTFTDGPGPFTIIAPNNAAFNAIGISTVAQINALDTTDLTTLIVYHILPGERPIIDIPRGPNAPLSAQSGGSVFASKNGGITYLNGVRVVTPDIKASNGIIHIVDKVLSVPFNNVLGVLVANPQYKLFVQAINRGAVAGSFTGTGPITVFAPDNAAFMAAGLDSTAIANSTATTMSNITRYHIHTSRLYSSEFKTDSLRTVHGSKIAMTGATNTTVRGRTNTAAFSIPVRDVTATNGVIHGINGVLRP